MMSPHEEFAASFDNARVAPRTAAGETPGFYLVDDCNGRFTIDQAIGVVSLAHEHLLTLEAGAVHVARVRVVEMSGASYEMNLKLRMTGRVPQIVGGEDNDFLAGLASGPIVDLMTPQEKAVHKVVVPEPPALSWLRYAAARTTPGKRPLYGETAPFGALFETPGVFPDDIYVEEGELGLDAPLPRPSDADAAWIV